MSAPDESEDHAVNFSFGPLLDKNRVALDLMLERPTPFVASNHEKPRLFITIDRHSVTSISDTLDYCFRARPENSFECCCFYHRDSFEEA
jgi:hypothetical protein